MSEKTPLVDFSCVIKGMQEVVNEAQKLLEMHNLKPLKNLPPTDFVSIF